MRSIRCRAEVLSRCRVLLALTLLLAALGSHAWAQENSPSASEASLDRAVQQLDASPAASEVAPAPSPVAEEPQTNAIGSFCASWHLFQYSYLEGWVIGLLLALVGVVVVARDQVFIGAAVSQASTLGIALALAVGSTFPVHHEDSLLPHSESWFCCDSFQAVMAVAFSMLAALLTVWADRVKRESHEAITGWVFLISGSLSVLVVTHSPHGLEEIYRVHSSSIIGATALDVGIFGLLLAITVLLLAATRQRLLLFVTDPSMAAAVGMRVGLWSVAESLWLGLVVGLSIRATGMLYTFGGLVLPALVAKNVCREIGPMFWVAPAVALATNSVGFVIANHYDFPPAQMNVALTGLVLAVAWSVRGLRRGNRFRFGDRPVVRTRKNS